MANQKPELLPCPHCGGTAEVSSNPFNTLFWVTCLKCGCRTSDRVKKQTAVTNWNRRV